MNTNSDEWIGGSVIILVKNGEQTTVKTNIFDTGIYRLDLPLEADDIIVYRVDHGGGSHMELAHLRAY